MTAFLNRIQLIGNLGVEPKTITGKSGQPFVTATLATNEPFKLNEEWQTRTEWHQLIFFGSLTKITDYLRKGSLVFVEGKLRSTTWADEEGNQRHSISIVVNNLQLLGQSPEKSNSSTPVVDSHMAKMREMLQDNTSDEPF